MSTTTKNDLIDYISNNAGLTKTDAEAALSAMTNGIKTALTDGNKVTLVGFGSFTVNNRSARKGRNPQTGDEIDIPASNSVKFKAGTALKKSVN
jgi:DNA-binding protein HU-beta